MDVETRQQQAQVDTRQVEAFPELAPPPEPPNQVAQEEEGPGEPPETPAGWEVRTVADADWALMRIAQAERQLEELEAQEERAIQRIQERIKALKAEHLHTREHFTAHLRRWAEANRELVCQGRKKSRNFLHGSLGFRTVPRKLVPVDTEALVAWAKGQPNPEALVRVKEEPDLVAIKARVMLTPPPGMRWVPASEAFDVKPQLPEEEG